MFESYKDLALEAAWRLTPGRWPRAKPSWPLDADWLGSVTLVWPTRYQWPLMPKWVEPLRRGLARIIEIKEQDLPQPYEGVVLLELRSGQGSRTIAIDCFDKATLNVPCVERSDLYFKMQYQNEGYPWAHVVPGGYGPADGSVYRYLPRLRALAEESPVFEVYGRFGLEFATDLRREAIRRLSDSAEIQYGGGAGIVRYSRFLREVALAKVCINLPGNGDLCFRLIDYFAVGACVVSPRLLNSLHVPLVDRVHIVYAKDDLSDLVPLCRQYVEDVAARNEIRRNARALFDDFLASDQLAAYYVSRCQEHFHHELGGRAVVA
jgi:hypothetical protein